MRSSLREVSKDIPLKTKLKVDNEIAFIRLITELGFREERSWGEDEDELLDKIFVLAQEHTDNIIADIEEEYSKKHKNNA